MRVKDLLRHIINADPELEVFITDENTNYKEASIAIVEEVTYIKHKISNEIVPLRMADNPIYKMEKVGRSFKILSIE